MGKHVGLSSKLIAETDAKFVDVYSYWQKIKQHGPASIASLGLLPSSIRKTSTKVVYNPTESETKELSLHFTLGKSLTIFFFKSCSNYFLVNGKFESERVYRLEI